MKNSTYRRLAPVAFVLILSTLACLFNTKAPTANPSGPSVDLGDQNVPEPASGLQDLKSYQAELTVTFEGTQAGAASRWTTVYTLFAEPAMGTRLVSVASTGLPAESSLDGWMAGSYRGLLIERAGAWGPCGVQKHLGDPINISFQPAKLLPPVKGAVAAGTENVQGISSDHFTFGQAAVGFPGKGTVSGDMWLSGVSNYVLKYSLRAEGGPDLFEEDMQGTMTWDYALSQVNQAIQVELPENCPPGMLEFPIMDRAEVIADQPGLQEYTIDSDLTGVMGFYAGNANALEYNALEPFDLSEEPQPSQTMAHMTYVKGYFEVNVLMEWLDEDTTHVLVTLEHSKNGGQIPTPAPTSTPDPSVTQAQRLGQALNLLLGSSDKPSPLGSYHLELSESVPGIDRSTGKAQVADVKIVADVDGPNYYFQHVRDGESASDGYMVDGQEYVLKNGQATEGFGLIEVDWAFWPLDLLMPYGIASLGPTPAGQENVDGRAADVFDLDSARADPLTISALQGMNPFSEISVMAASGRVWLDKQTGAVLRLDLSYTGEIKDAQGTSLGTENGEIHLSVSQVGAVSVKLP